MYLRASILSACTLGILSACATVPTGPSVAVMPAPRSNFEQFRADDAVCRDFARSSIGGDGQAIASKSAIDSAAVGTAVGAAAGALIGAASGNPGAGAAIGAGGGVIVGSAYGADAYNRTGATAQERYDIAYMQCMYAKGHQIPSAYGIVQVAPAANNPPPSPQPASVPPPPRQPAP